MASNRETGHIAALGAGLIGLGWIRLFTARGYEVVVADPRPDLADVIATLPDTSGVRIADDMAEAMAGAAYVQESGPESVAFKRAVVQTFADAAPADALLLSSSSAIPASVAASEADDATAARVSVGHPFNPPYVMPLVEVVPGERTSAETVDRALAFYRGLGKEPVLVAKEVPGFVQNRLQKAIWNEAFSLVQAGVIDAAGLDSVMKNSLGLRWACVGVFEGAALGGGAKGMEGLLTLVRDSFAEIDLGTQDWSDEAMAPLYAMSDALYGKPADPALAQRRDEWQAEILCMRGQEGSIA